MMYTMHVCWIDANHSCWIENWLRRRRLLLSSSSSSSKKSRRNNDEFLFAVLKHMKTLAWQTANEGRRLSLFFLFRFLGMYTIVQYTMHVIKNHQNDKSYFVSRCAYHR